MRLLEVTAIYKLGHTRICEAEAIHPRTIIRVCRMTEEVPEHQEGVNTRLQLLHGEWVPLADEYQDVVNRLNALLDDET